MELGSPRFEGMGNTVRKKRSQPFRRPKLEASPIRDGSSLSSTPPSDDVSKVSSDENTGGDTNSGRKEFSLNQCVLRDSSSIGNALNDKRCSEGVLATAYLKSTRKIINCSEFSSGDNGDAVGVDNKVKKVKLKVGGVTRTIQAKFNSLGASGSETSVKGSRNSDDPRSRRKLSHQDDSDDDHSSLEKNIGLRGIPWKDFTIANSSGGKEDFQMGKMSEKSGSESIRKSKRVPKKRVLDAASEDDEDAEIKYLEKMKNAKVAILNRNLEEESSKKRIRISGLSKKSKLDETSDDSLSSKLGRDGKKSSRLERGSEDTNYEDEEELISEGEQEVKNMKKLNKDSADLNMEIKREPALTTRQRALLSGKDASSGSTGIEFPNGLPPAAPRRQKEKLTEVEQQLKKAEAAQRRRLQVEKAARESEAEAIRKILGQDSSRKKREDKNKKRQEELEQEKAANALKLASNTVRWVMGPTGTVVAFPNEMGLPSIFNPSTRSYPPPREKCAGPSCNNPYKYRDSKTKVPLCSLQCYKAVQASDNGTSISPMPY